MLLLDEVVRRPIELVRQRSPHACGVACLAMLLRCSYEEALLLLERDVEQRQNDERFGDFPYIGVTADEVAHLLWRHGIPALWYIPAEAFPEDSWRRDYASRLCVLQLADLNCHLANGGEALLGVPSKNNKDGLHWIVASGCRIFDPAPEGKQTYAWDEEFPVQEAVLAGVSRTER